MQAASASSSPYAQTTHRWDGLEGTRKILALNDALTDDSALETLIQKFKKIQKILIAAPMQFLLINEDKSSEEINNCLTQLWQHLPEHSQSRKFTVPFEQKQINQAWTTSTQVNFCAKSYLTVPSNHEDAPAFVVLGNFLRNGFLHRSIREQGGAYGGGAAYMADSGTFRFFSYRDPRLSETLADFDNSLQWLQTNEHDENTVEEAILGVISDIDRPSSPAVEARSAWYANLHGRSPDSRRIFRKRIMQVKLSDLLRVGEKWLRPEDANTAVITSAATLDKHNKENPDSQLQACPVKALENDQ